MKILLLADLHHKNIEYFVDYQLSFLKNLINLIQNKKIDRLFILGDVMDNRFVLDIRILNLFRDVYSEISKYVDIYIICGNHDKYHNNINSINSLDSIFVSKNNHIIVDRPFKIDNCVLVPFINESNIEKITDFISKNNSSNNYLFGHFELSGFRLSPTGNRISKHTQLYRTDYDHYKKVFSGHFHSKQEKNNVLYVGSPYQLSFDELEEKGIFILDTDTDKLDFICNRNEIYKKFYIEEDSDLTILKDITNKIVKIYVNSSDPEFLSLVELEIEKYAPKTCNTYSKNIDIIKTEENDDASNFENDLHEGFLDSLNYDTYSEKEVLSKIFKKTYDLMKNVVNN